MPVLFAEPGAFGGRSPVPPPGGGAGSKNMQLGRGGLALSRRLPRPGSGVRRRLLVEPPGPPAGGLTPDDVQDLNAEVSAIAGPLADFDDAPAVDSFQGRMSGVGSSVAGVGGSLGSCSLGAQGDMGMGASSGSGVSAAVWEQAFHRGGTGEAHAGVLSGAGVEPSSTPSDSSTDLLVNETRRREVLAALRRDRHEGLLDEEMYRWLVKHVYLSEM
mmetsp:Transcript_17966/g.54941  ORF Transcript_17966/g.54941 Transcript_17966/m.54941 type:complete len:216 (-) Transcript_17966:663-1310(-)|eukprot:CAMPEP_0118881578 /NCGR_PEP_ID=MMETSP1163-20130328/21025_1 /TAXON_ID=124430 /ORGANISM="Phaeomonas parva, Strain CCMP2877" /LENGTH=215 /DNA_ID=CAMNT_0006818395 /DNA_START=271 /DNA_END=918 /DNA_ORIENTATION=-